MQRKTISVPLAGKNLIFETGKIAKQANGSVLVHCDETTVLATACASKKASEEIDFLPFKVDYQEKFSSVGKTLGGFIKREGKPSLRETLISRFIDRTLRPLFPDCYYNEVQILSYVYSYDGLYSPDVLSICASSAALAISDIPLSKPAGAVRVGLIEGKFIINPTTVEQQKSSLDLVIGGTEEAILMIEGYANFLDEATILEAIEEGHKAVKVICSAITKWASEVGKQKTVDTIVKIPKELENIIHKIAKKGLINALKIGDKQQREAAFDEIAKKVDEELFPKDKEPLYLKRDVEFVFKSLSSSLMRKMILEENRRIDGRRLDEIRPIDIEVSLLPRTHGSALFTRGETQALAVCTLGGESMAQRYEDLHGEGAHRFYLQYFFPPFSVGEVGKNLAPGRREIGHGKLAERALMATLPDQVDFPYIIRLESNITESNGSSSMASVCGGSIALMDAGVPIKKAVSGIAMGLILEEDKFSILSDILGAEDALGDMDFKVTGDENGITAFQMDIKVEGITKEIMKKALEQAKKGRIQILEKMLSVCPKHKEKISKYAPCIEKIQVKPSQIGIVIGPGGKQIRAIIEETGVDIDINDEGVVSITSTNSEAMQKAKEIIINLTAEVEVGKIYKGKIVSIVPFGLFIAIYSKEGLCHISEVAHKRIEDLHEFYKEGDEIEVKVIDINDRGQIKLSHKALLQR